MNYQTLKARHRLERDHHPVMDGQVSPCKLDQLLMLCLES